MIRTTNKKLKRGKRELSFNINSSLYLPEYSDETDDLENIVLKTITEVKEFFEQAKDEVIDDEVLGEIFAIIDSSTAIVKPKERVVSLEDNSSKAYILKQLEAEIAKFDDKQKYAALSQLEGPQRIRGLAGSGKTIILCMKAAMLHLRNPEAKILYTFKTKSLYDYIELLITRFYKSLTDGFSPDLENAIQIRHSWGGVNLKGVYYEACANNGVLPVDYKTAMMQSQGKDPFDYACKELLKQTQGKLKQSYDYVLIDEAQDFKPPFYQICRAIVKNDCLVWCYDELQNIFNVDIQDTRKTFKNEFGTEGIDLGELQRNHPDMDNDIILHRSYRNPKEILVMAHAIGFGIYNDKLIQTLQNNDHWADLGYEVLSGNCNNGERLIIKRRSECSPLSLNNYNTPNEIIEVYSADTFIDELDWVCEQIKKAINEEGLRPDDIIVISIDDRNSKSYFSHISTRLREAEIYTLNLSDNFYKKGFVEEKCVTLSTVYKAKGNEAAMVFVVGCDVVEAEKDDRTMRNKLFTAFTRAKAWLKISGIRIDDSSLYKEIEKIKENDFILDFIYKSAHIIQRDLDSANTKKATQRRLFEEMMEKARDSGFTEEEIMDMIRNYNNEGRCEKK